MIEPARKEALHWTQLWQDCGVAAEATLFGYEKPAFPSDGRPATPGYFEEASGRTLLLDELGN